ncbi:ABC-F family ATP-binding cassette domain-containing protein [Candidatus Latescibacterota bacterium]
MLTVSNITKSFGDRILFSSVSFTVSSRDRYGIIGANGTGKTTLLEIIAGNAEYDSGSVFFQKGASKGYLEQNLSFETDNDLITEVMSVQSEAEKYEHKKSIIHDSLADTNDPDEQAELLKELADIETREESLNDRSQEFEAKKILSGLGFTEQDFTRKIREFSGGWIMRAGMARLLLSEPDLLLLDEPTNHLDLTALIWLEYYLKSYQGAIIIVSHDREFLNRSTSKLVALAHCSAKLYHGNYDFYITSRKKEDEVLASTIKNQERFIESEQRFIDRFRAKNTKATQVQSRIKRLEKLEVATGQKKEREIRIKIPPSPRSGKMVISLNKVSFGYDCSPLYSELDLTLIRGDKAVLVGQNGSGKTTLLKLIAGVLDPTDGSRTYGHNVSGTYYAQHQMDQLRQENTALEEMRLSAVDETDERLRSTLGAFLFTGDDVSKKVGILSGGEKARLALAKLLLRPTNLILMDEPTNHLDMASIDILIDMLSDYDGTLCLVTHDRSLIDRVAGKIIEIENGGLTEYIGNYSDYKGKKQLEGKNDTGGDEYSSQIVINGGKRNSEKERKRQEGELRNLYYQKSRHLRRRIEILETEIPELEGRLSELETLLSDPSQFNSRDAFNETLDEYDTFKRRKSSHEDEWLELSEEIEQIRISVYVAE